MPVAIKAHLHNVCAKNNYELLIARRSPQKRLGATGLGVEREAQMEGRRRGRQRRSEPPLPRFHGKLLPFHPRWSRDLGGGLR